MAELCDVYYRAQPDPWKESRRREMEEREKTPEQREAERRAKLEACEREIQRLERDLLAARSEHRRLQVTVPQNP